LSIRSTKAVTWLLRQRAQEAVDRLAALTKASTAGIDWMPICCAICWKIAGCSSMFILTSLTLPLPASFTAFSSTGVSCLQGPHHGAQKSTSTGWFIDSAMTSWRKPCVVVSLIIPLVGAASPLTSMARPSLSNLST
jgi:hypothetical protein